MQSVKTPAMPRLMLDWDLTAGDHAHLAKAANQAAQGLQAAMDSLPETYAEMRGALDRGIDDFTEAAIAHGQLAEVAT